MTIVSIEDIGKDLSLKNRLISAICSRHALSKEIQEPQRCSQFVFFSGEKVVKIFSDEDEHFFHNECLFLEALSGQLHCKTPELLERGMIENLHYLIMEKIPGVPLDTIWSKLKLAEKKSIIIQIARIMKEFHRLALDSFEGGPFKWHEFIDYQQNHVLEHHRRMGLEDSLIAEIPAILASLNSDFHDSANLVPLHTELMLDHFLIDESNLRIEGIIDFEPSMIGIREYEWPSAAIFICQGQKDLLKLLLREYGYENEVVNDELQRKLFIFLLLHRYSNLTWFKNLFPESGPMLHLTDLEKLWFSL